MRAAAWRRSRPAVGVQPEDLDRFLAQDAATYVEMGFTQFTLGFNGPGWSVDRGAPWLDWRDQRWPRTQPMRTATVASSVRPETR